MNGRAFSPERRTGANLQDADEEFSYRFAKRHASAFNRIGDFNLGNPAPSGAWNDVLQQDAAQ